MIFWSSESPWFPRPGETLTMIFKLLMVKFTCCYSILKLNSVEGLSNCLNHMLDDKAKFHPSLRRAGQVSAPAKKAPANKGPSSKPSKKKKWQKKKKMTKEQWAAKQAKRNARLGQ